MNSALQIHDSDTVAVALQDLTEGQTIELQTQPRQGRATAIVAIGEHVHTHNLTSALSAQLDCTYAPIPVNTVESLGVSWRGYRRSSTSGAGPQKSPRIRGRRYFERRLADS